MGMVTRGLTGLGRMRHRNEAKIMTLKSHESWIPTSRMCIQWSQKRVVYRALVMSMCVLVPCSKSRHYTDRWTEEKREKKNVVFTGLQDSTVTLS
jgi:hypothetical protein